MVHFRENTLLDKAIAEVNVQHEKDFQSLGTGKWAVVIFVGKSCKCHELKI